MNKKDTTKATRRAHKRALQVEQTKRGKTLVATWRTAQSAGEDVIASSKKLRHQVKTGLMLSELTREERKIVEDAWARDDEDRRERAKAHAERSVVEAWRRGETEQAASAWRKLDPGGQTAALEMAGEHELKQIKRLANRQVKDARDAARPERERKRALRREAAVQAVEERIGAATDRVRAAVVAGITVQALTEARWTKADRDAVRDLRTSAMRLSAAAQRIGIPKGRLDRWEREGWISCSFTRETRITGAGVVDMRVWFPDDADAIKARVETLDARDAERRRNARAERKKAAEQRKREPGYRAPPKRVMRKNVPPCDDAPTVEAEIANAQRKDGADRDRADDTATPFIAIDPHSAKDRDDAVWAKRLDTGRWHVKVAIADVGAYVQAGSALDAAARERAQSIYLVNECIHMCPEPLSNETCSLHEGGCKRVLVTEFMADEHGGVTPIRAMEPAWIEIDRAITYEDAKEQIDAGACATLSALDGCAQALRRARRSRGAIVLECSDEIAMVAGADGAGPRPVRRVAHRAHHLIEEMMIAANVVNARWLDGHTAGGAVYRTHPEPGTDKDVVVFDHAWTWGIVLDKGDSTGEWMRTILSSNRASQRLRELMVKQGMEKAHYDTKAASHFALDEAIYAHTTSPIRRYADLRCQQAAHGLHGTGPPVQTTRGQELTNHLNATEVQAKERERRSVRHAICQALEAHIPTEWGNGTITGVQPWGAFAELEEWPGIEGVRHVSREPNFDDPDIFVDMRDKWLVGQRVLVRFTGLDTWSAQVDAEIQKPRSMRRSERAARARRRRGTP